MTSDDGGGSEVGSLQLRALAPETHAVTRLSFTTLTPSGHYKRLP